MSKNWRKLIFAVIIAAISILLITFLFGCNSSTKTTKSNEPALQQKLEPKAAREVSLIPWENKPAIKDDSKLSFFNEFEINIVGFVPNYIYQTNNGVQEKIDKSTNFNFKIPKGTPGSLVKNGVIRDSSGQVIAIKVSYFDNDDSYVIFSKEEGSEYFFIELEATIVSNGKEYKIDLSTVGNGTHCRALYDENNKDESTKVEKVAKGKIIPGVQKLP